MKHSISFEKIIPDSEKSHIALLANSYYEGVVCDTIQTNFRGFRSFFYRAILEAQTKEGYDRVKMVPLDSFPGIDVVYDKIDDSGARIIKDFYLNNTRDKPAFSFTQNVFKENGLSFSFETPDQLAARFVERYIESIPKENEDGEVYFVDFVRFCWDSNSVNVVLTFKEFVFSDVKAINFLKTFAWKK